jgi:hypothetical protein
VLCQSLDIAENDDEEPKIMKMYWAYWNGEKYMELEEDRKTRHYVDLSFVVETKNYKDGDSIEITIENDDGQPLFDETFELKLTGIVSDNRVIFENVFNKYTLNC